MRTTRLTAAVAALAAAGALLVAPAAPAAADLEPGFGHRTPALARGADGRLNLFATDGADRVRQRAQTTPGAETWTGWTELGGRMRSLAAETTADGRIALVGVDRTGQAFERRQAAAGGWTDWTGLDRSLVSVALVRNGTGRLELFGVTPERTVVQRVETGDGVWDGWRLPLRHQPAVRAVAAEATADGRVMLVLLTPSGSTYRSVQLTPGGEFGVLSFTDSRMTSVAIARNAPGNDTLELFATDAAGVPFHTWQTGAEWTPWTAFDGRARSLAAEANADGRLELVGLDNVGRAYHRWQRPGGWSPWARLPGDLAATYADGGAVTTVDGSIHETVAGQSNAIVTGADGFGLISYHDSTLADLRVAHCLDQACSTTERTTVDSSSSVGRHSAIAVGPDGFGRIAYTSHRTANGLPSQYTWDDLLLARCVNIGCTQVDRRVLRTEGRIVGPLAMTMTAGGAPLVVFGVSTDPIDFTDPRYTFPPQASQLWIAACGDASCAQVSVRMLGFPASGASVPSVVTGADGLPLVVWEGTAGSEPHLYVTHCRDRACGAFDTFAVDHDPAGAGTFSSVTLGADNLPLIAYTKAGAVHVVHCTSVTCGTWDAPTLVDGGVAARHTAVRVADDGLGIIVYHDRAGLVLRAAHCNNVACTNPTKATFARAGYHAPLGLAVGADGLPLASYHNDVAGSLGVVHCSNPRCVSFRLPPALTPPPAPAGTRVVQVVNCQWSTRPLSMWVRDLTAGTGWVRTGTAPTAWNEVGCGFAYGGLPWEYRPEPGHTYEIRGVDFTGVGCADTPEYAPCWRVDLRDVLGDPAGGPSRTEVWAAA